jgi:small-conductance mechanosensitive channel
VVIESSGSRIETPRVRVALAIACLVAFAPSLLAQPNPAAQPAPTSIELAIAESAAAQADSTAAPPAMLTYANRQIVQFRATFLGRSPSERALAVQARLDQSVRDGLTGPVEVRAIGGVFAFTVAGRDIFALMPADVDTLAGETLEEVAARGRARVELALNEAVELRRPRQMLVSTLLALLATVAFASALWGLIRARVRVNRRLSKATADRIQAIAVGNLEFVGSLRISETLSRSVTFLIGALALFLAYSWLTFVLARFPYSRPWGESLRGLLLNELVTVGTAIVGALPGLFMIGVIAVLTRLASNIAHRFFNAVEDGRFTAPWVYPETAQTTGKLVNVALWLFALALAYPYLPGSQSQAFQGVSVFVGLVVSLGSSGLVNQVMSGFTLTYSRALRVGDFVTVGEVEGTVAQLGTLSTKIKTARGEDVTIPNAVVVSHVVTNHSRFANTDGVFVPTSITIGYDTPWRQVEALLLLAASRTPGIRRTPAPVVRQPSLQDFYVKYTLLFCLEQPAERAKVLAAVHTSILDAFNEYGVQITSPNYEADPERPKVVPRDKWFAAPAAPPEVEERVTSSSAGTASGSPSPLRG